MDDQVRLSIEPLAPAKWFDHPLTGAGFQVAHLEPARDEDLQRECMRTDGTLDQTAFAQRVAAECLKGWTGIGDKTSLLPCNAENIARFMKHHALTIGQWIILRARSLQHFREEALDAAKKD